MRERNLTNMIDLTHLPSEGQIYPSLATRKEIDLSVVIPVFNEVENVEQVHDKLSAVLDILTNKSEIVEEMSWSD